MYRYSSLALRCLLRSTTSSFLQTASVGAFKRSKLIGVSNEYEDLINTRLAENRPLSSAEWLELRTGLIATNRPISEINVDATILGRCVPDAQLEVGKSYFNFLHENGIKPNLATTGKLLRLYYASQNNLTEADKDSIVKMYVLIIIRVKNINIILNYRCNDLLLNGDNFDAITCESMLHALVTTSEWRKSVLLMDTIKLSAKPSTSAYCALASRAFAEQDIELGWKILTDCVANEKNPRCEVFLAYIRMCDQLYPDHSHARSEMLTRLIKFIGQSALTVSKSVVDELQRVNSRSGSAECHTVTIGDK